MGLERTCVLLSIPSIQTARIPRAIWQSQEVQVRHGQKVGKHLNSAFEQPSILIMQLSTMFSVYDVSEPHHLARLCFHCQGVADGSNVQGFLNYHSLCLNVLAHGCSHVALTNRKTFQRSNSITRLCNNH